MELKWPTEVTQSDMLNQDHTLWPTVIEPRKRMGPSPWNMRRHEETETKAAERDSYRFPSHKDHLSIWDG